MKHKPLWKQLPVEFATFLQWEGILTNWKCRKCWTMAFENSFLLQKPHKKARKRLKTMLKAWEMVLQVPLPMLNHFSEALENTLLSKLKWKRQKTKKAHISVWPAARKRCFDKLVLIWQSPFTFIWPHWDLKMSLLCICWVLLAQWKSWPNKCNGTKQR